MMASSLPVLDRVEYHLARSRYAAWAIDHAIHWPRRWLLSRAQEPLELTRFERSIYSQNGEDGLLEEIFRRIGEGARRCVEFGYDPQCCTRRLIVERGWHGLLIDGAPWVRDWALPMFASSDAKLVTAFITRENILSLLANNGTPKEPDLLVVDIDGNDYWVLLEILESGYEPRVIVCEYNGRWVPPVEWVMPYNAQHAWDGSTIQGASLAAIGHALRARGYRLVACDQRGVNGFFVRGEYCGEFPDASRSLRDIYRVPQFGRGFGHPVRMRQPIDYGIKVALDGVQR